MRRRHENDEPMYCVTRSDVLMLAGASFFAGLAVMFAGYPALVQLFQAA